MKQLISFRYRLVQNLLQLVKAGESGAVVGLAGVGKSELARYLCRIDVADLSTQRLSRPPMVILIDSNSLTSIEGWYFFEYLLYNLHTHCQKIGLANNIISHIERLHNILLTRKEFMHAQRCFEQAIEWLCEVNNLKIVFLFDHFDLFFEESAELPSRLLTGLRATVDKSNHNLVYLLFLREDLATLRFDNIIVGPFVELFQSSTFGLKPYDLHTTDLMLNDLSARQQFRWPAQYTKMVYELSGGHAGLIKAIFGSIWAEIKMDSGLTLAMSISWRDQGIEKECWKIWKSLSDQEKLFIREIVKTDQPEQYLKKASKAVVHKVTLKEIIRYIADQPRIFSDLFNQFIQHVVFVEVDKKDFGFDFDEDSQTCWINGQEINLPSLPARLLGLLYQNRGRICKQREIWKYLYPDEDYIADLNNYRLPAVVKSLREKIDIYPQSPSFIKTIRGVGFKLDIDEVNL